MNLIYTPNLIKDLRGSNLVIDTCVLIDATKYDEVENFLRRIRGDDCTFVSVPAMRDEFVCMARNKKEQGSLIKMIKSFDISFPDLSRMTGGILEDYRAFSILLAHCPKIKPSYVDRQLLAIPHIYRKTKEKTYLMTSNHKDVPDGLFKRVHFICFDTGEFRNIGVYELDHGAVVKMARGLAEKNEDSA